MSKEGWDDHFYKDQQQINIPGYIILIGKNFILKSRIFLYLQGKTL
ncbi:hypothetical protein SBF1_3400004 [Candidatus Desulfosporosinus infrequens]|uniref:Uncharacterized protein n=1 Tax=Candidatus Desulfosporosinus infrequens TaxID=2043169 RepID=A0A2U3L1X2_9FIRM|nr:hypothetical protein SBF1_3400004 [Candidatus Desulfosporosinus infrequens]